ncbi:hypothetical protein T01_13290 [Trichinella spiralis]|uniref:Uncharacterized protein n=1 Tax=Trichinella spiralis TaxID=6334 RepID=A0A0V1ANE7_TRISP|nr:hypothetical protein T01_13290 [Trichinella spiralis]
MSLNVETWFENLEKYFCASRIAPERRASLFQYHTDEEVPGVMRAMHVQVTDDYDGLKSALLEAFGVRTGSERFSAEFFRRKQQRGESVRIYAGHSRWLFTKAFTGLSAREERIWTGLTVLKESVSSVKADADQEDLQPAVDVTEAIAAPVTTRKEVGEELAEVARQLKQLLMTDITAAAKRATPQQRRRQEKKDRRTCWTCGRTGHICRRAHGHWVRGNPSGRKIYAGLGDPVGRHSHRRRQARAVLPNADRPLPANAGGISPARNVEARRCGAVEQPLGVANLLVESVGGDGDVPLVLHQEDTILCIPPAREWTSGEVHVNAPRHAVHHVRWEPAPVGRHAAVCHAGVQQQRSREHGDDACYRHVWRRAAATVGRAHWEPAGARNPKDAGIHAENLRAHRPCARAPEGPPVNAAASTEVPLDLGWEEPYMIMYVMGSQTFRVRHQEQKCRSLVEHSDRMKRYYTREFAGERSFRGGTTRQQEHHPFAAEHHQTAGTYLVLHAKTQ